MKRFSREKELEIVDLYRKGYNQKEIANMYSTYNTSIRRALLKIMLLSKEQIKD